MSGSRETVPAAYFEQLYRSDPDPWRFESSAYERAKYLTTLAALPRRRYRRACEIGCANGVLTRQLAARCDELLAIDVADTALARARARTVDQPWVRCERLAVPEAFPTGPFDLVLLSEVGYYLASEALCDLRARLAAALSPRGDLVLVHWTPRSDDRALTGDAVHAILLAADGPFRRIAGGRAPGYRLDVLRLRASPQTQELVTARTPR
jgi:predicted TPR repeat methyltransferase